MPRIGSKTQYPIDPKEPEDPFNRLWQGTQGAQFNKRRIFDHDLLRSIYMKPKKKSRDQGALGGGLVLGIMSLPFGPIGMAAGGSFGALTGALLGFCIDTRTRLTKLQEMDVQRNRLRSLVRWAAERFDKDEDILRLIELVTLEFKPVADIAGVGPEGSSSARKLLLLLDTWIAQKKVTRMLWVYMDRLLKTMSSLNRGEFLRSMLVFQTLLTMYKHTRRALSEQEEQFVYRMERLLAHKSVKLVMEHAKNFPTEGETRVMECMVYADSVQPPRGGSGKRSPKQTGSPRGKASDVEAQQRAEDDSDSDKDILGGYFYTSPSKGEDDDGEASEIVVASERPKRKTLKKPFFRSWNDFMDFDTTFKHKMPITLSEFELLLQKEAESNKGWDMCIDRKNFKVSKIQTGPGVITLRCWATVPNVQLSVAFFLFYDIQERIKWDRVFSKMEQIEESADGYDILYSVMRIPTVTPREWLQFRRVRVQEDGSVLIVLRSADNGSVPEDKHMIRVENYISGYVLRQSWEGDTPLLNIFIMSSSDVKGMIPKWIVNMFAPKKPIEWVEGLRKASVAYQEAHPNCAEECKAITKRFMGYTPYDYEPEDQDQDGTTPKQATLQARPLASRKLPNECIKL